MKILAGALLVIAMWATPADAQCVIDAVSGPAFGSYNPLSGAAVQTVGSVTYRCLLSLSVTIDLGTGSSGTYAARTMTRIGGGSTLSYNLFRDAAFTQVWGNGTAGTSRYGPVLGLLVGVIVPIFGQIPGGQDVSVGSYTDTVVVTLNF